MAAGNENRHPLEFFRCCMHRLSTFTFFVLRDFMKVSTSFVITLYIRYTAISALIENGWKVVTAFPFQLNSYNPPIRCRRSNIAREAAHWYQYALRIWNVRSAVITYVICGAFIPDTIKIFRSNTKLIYLKFPALFLPRTFPEKCRHCECGLWLHSKL
jgi:hypothetical protein